PVLELEAGKATMEIPSPVSGTVTKLFISQGDTVAIGQLVMSVDAKEESAAPAPAKKPEPVKEAVAAKPAPAVQAAPPPPPAPAPVQPPVSAPVAAPAPVASSSPKERPIAVSAAPQVRRLARELGVDIHHIHATGPAGYITLEDVKAFAKETLSRGGIPVAGPVRVEKMSSVRKATMRHMTHCWTTIPHVTQQDTANITKLEALRKHYAPRAEAVGAKLTMTAIIIKVLASALKVHPKFNCSINPEKEEIIFKDYYNIGIAMDTPKGLLVPVITNGDKKNFVTLAQELGALGARARDGKLTAEDLKGGTFTFTNLGGIGGTFFTPIVNSPEVAILGTGRAYWEMGPSGEKVFKLPLSLSYDHRIIDGADGARFLKWVVEAMEEPMLLSLEG
ncbi:MAG: biotin/lipoyl-binding protein, partial [Kiritimatiellaceae bacterium]|nr:biotin/lipoyl-binding protein [Kiritimatiellaceae bacterium]